MPQLSDEQRAELKGIVKQVIREKIAQREDLRDQAAVMRQIWAAIVASPTWSIVCAEKPPDTPSEADEMWTLTPEIRRP